MDVQALLVETLSGQKFSEYVRQHVFEPLGMRETAWRQPDDRLPRLAAMYRKSDGKIVRDSDDNTRRLNFHDNRLTGGGFGLASTVDDYMHLARMLLNAGEFDGARLLKPSTVKLMSTDQLDPRITERLFLPSKGSGRLRPGFCRARVSAEEARGEPRSSRRIFLGWRRVDALLGGSGESHGRRVFYSEDAVRWNAASRYPRRHLRRKLFGSAGRLSGYEAASLPGKLPRVALDLVGWIVAQIDQFGDLSKVGCHSSNACRYGIGYGHPHLRSECQIHFHFGSRAHPRA